ncbi:hypothetical protein [Adlercreutzia murintestinalis]|uniref:hypothetical protein n=1 Tax=Adlercreutzia murintestinalis TaxID=2941325 RepID=UPI00203B9BE1|nr:hypothetical protein [Adlercreutzia murintestinalis]
MPAADQSNEEFRQSASSPKYSSTPKTRQIKHLIPVICTIFALFAFGFILFKQDNPIISSHFLAGEVIYAGIALLCIITVLPKAMIFPLGKWIEARRMLYKSIAYLFLGVLASLFISYWSTNIAQNQMDIANRETAPQLTVSTFEENGSKFYEVSNAKGMATYVSLDVREVYHFPYEGENCEVGLLLPVQLNSDTVQLDSQNSSILFQQEYNGFDRDKTYLSLNNYLRTKGIDADMLSRKHEITIEFFDHNNQQQHFVFIEGEDGIALSSTNTYGTIPKRNITSSLWSVSDADATVRDLAAQVMAEDYGVTFPVA